MVSYLSPEWIDELHRALSQDPAVRDATSEVSLTVQQVVSDGPHGEVAWSVRVAHGDVSVIPGRAATADVTFTQTYDTAVKVARGEISAQAAFMIGKMKVSGDVSQLISYQDAFTSIDDATDALRAATTH